MNSFEQQDDLIKLITNNYNETINYIKINFPNYLEELCMHSYPMGGDGLVTDRIYVDVKQEYISKYKNDSKFDKNLDFHEIQYIHTKQINNFCELKIRFFDDQKIIENIGKIFATKYRINPNINLDELDEHIFNSLIDQIIDDYHLFEANKLPDKIKDALLTTKSTGTGRQTEIFSDD